MAQVIQLAMTVTTELLGINVKKFHIYPEGLE